MPHSFGTKAHYGEAVKALAEVLKAKRLVISALTVSESSWAVAKLYNEELTGKRGRKWAHDIFVANHARLFERFGDQLNAVAETLRMWAEAGIQLQVVPPDGPALLELADAAHDHMRSARLASSDALHLAAAEKHAEAMLTTDHGFEAASSSAIEILHIGT